MLHPDFPDLAASLAAVHVDIEGVEVIRGIDLDVPRGRITVIAGPNGAGKSTLLDVLAGARSTSAGVVRISASSLAYAPQRAEAGELVPLSTADVVAIGTWGRLGPWRRQDAATRRTIDDMLDRLDLAGARRAPFSSLSGGQRQRALLAQAFVRQAELVLLDEPTTALDAAGAPRVLAALQAEARRGAAVVCVSHDAAVLALADRIVRLDAGRARADDPLRQA